VVNDLGGSRHRGRHRVAGVAAIGCDFSHPDPVDIPGVEGIASILFALDHKRELSGRWGVMLFSGIVDLVLASIIFAGLPGTAAWAIGLLIGVNLVFGGAALIAMALHARDAAAGTA
jgi:hypothetical protein